MAKIFWISDMDFAGSGYGNITRAICDELVKLGHEIKVAGLFYEGNEHEHGFSIFPAKTVTETMAMAQNMYNEWPFDAMVVALDIPLQEHYLKLESKPFKYIGIFPVEADPLIFEFAAVLMQMDKQFVISDFGTNECLKQGITTAEHIVIGLDTDAWRMPSDEEKAKIKESFGLDGFCVLTNADNQERKNLSHCMDAFAMFAEGKDDVKYVMITREDNPIGWKLRDYAQELGISDKFVMFNRGLDFRTLWSVYSACDVLLLLSKAEGLGMPLLEGMAVGLPCIATDCTGMKELLSDGRGYLVTPEYIHRDPFLNGRRYWANREQAAGYMEEIYKERPNKLLLKARAYIEARDWADSAAQIDEFLNE